MHADHNLQARLRAQDPVQSEGHRMLVVWANWSRDRSYRSGCRSIECRYRPERTGEPSPPSLPDDLGLALAVEKALTVDCPLIWQAVIVAAYLTRAPDDAIPALLRKQGLVIRRDAVSDTIARARAAIRNRVLTGIRPLAK